MNNLIFKIAIFLFFLAPIFSYSLSTSSGIDHSSNIREILSSIPSEDLASLEILFKILFVHGEFAYTLFDEKPMALIDYPFNIILQIFPNLKTMNSFAQAYTGSNTWKKYKHLFKITRFEFASYESNNFEVFGFVLFNKKAIHALFEKHDDLLTSVFGDEATLYHTFERPPAEIIPHGNLRPKYHQALGILLGYGSKNSLAFRVRNEAESFLRKAPLCLNSLNKVDINHLQQERNWSSCIEQTVSADYRHSGINDAIAKLNNLRRVYKFTPATQREIELSPFAFPGFLALENDEETEQIKQSYDRVRSQIIDMMYSPNFLEKVLTLLTSKDDK